MNIRAHRGGLTESLETLKIISTQVELSLFVQQHDCFAELSARNGNSIMDGISIQEYHDQPDDRIGWLKTYAVYYGRGLVGFCDQPFEQLR